MPNPNLTVKWRSSLDAVTNRTTQVTSNLTMSPPSQLNCTTFIGTYDVQIHFHENGRTLESKLRSTDTEQLNVTAIYKGFYYDFIEPIPSFKDTLSERFKMAQAFAIEQAAVRQLIGNITYGELDIECYLSIIIMCANFLTL
jgi:hypothetical protein